MVPFDKEPGETKHSDNKKHMKHDKHGKSEKEREHPKHFTHNVSNTLENAGKSLTKAQESFSLLCPGKVWTHRAPRGELEIKGGLNLNDEVVLVLHFHPDDGSVLPKGLHPFGEGKPNIISFVEDKLKNVINELVMLDGAEFREPESCWAFPVAHKGRIVGHIKISSDGNKILPDKKASEEIAGMI